HDVDRLRDLAWRALPLRSRGQMWRGHLPSNVVHAQGVAGRLKIRGHAPAHDAQSDECYLHVVVSPLAPLARARAGMSLTVGAIGVVEIEHEVAIHGGRVARRIVG